MNALRRVLYIQATVWAVAGLFLVAVPRFTLVTVFGQPPYPDYAWVRIAGLDGFVLAMFMVLVAHHVEQTWWWTWGFVLATAAEAIIVTVNALVGIPPGAAVWPWWVFAVVSWALVAALLYGLARAGVDRPPT